MNSTILWITVNLCTIGIALRLIARAYRRGLNAGIKLGIELQITVERVSSETGCAVVIDDAAVSRPSHRPSLAKRIRSGE